MSVVTVHIYNSESTGSIETDNYFFVQIPSGSGSLCPDSATYPVVKVFDGRGYQKYGYTGGSVSGDFTYGGALLMPKTKAYQENGVGLPNYSISTNTPKKYTDKDSIGDAPHQTNRFGPSYTYGVPNYLVENKELIGSNGKEESFSVGGFRFSKDVNFPQNTSSNAYQFAFQKHCYLLFNNFNTTFSRGSTSTNAFTIKKTTSSVEISYKTHTKTIPIKSGDNVYLYIREPGNVSSTAQSKWHYYCYDDRNWSIYGKSNWDVYYGTASDVPEGEARHSFAGSAEISVKKIPNGTHVFNGETTPDGGAGESVSKSSPIYTQFVGSTSYYKEESISSTDNDGRVYNPAFASSGPSISYGGQRVYTRDMGPGGTYITYTSDQTKHTFTLEYDYFIGSASDSSFSGSNSKNRGYSLSSWKGEEDHCGFYARLMWGLRVNEIGLVKGKYAKEPNTFIGDTTVGKDNAEVNHYSTPTGSFSYHGQTFYNIDIETRSTYTEMSYTDWGGKPNVRGAFSHGLLINTEYVTGANKTQSYEFKAKSGYTNEPAIAVVLFTDTPDVTDLSSFNRRG